MSVLHSLRQHWSRNSQEQKSTTRRLQRTRYEKRWLTLEHLEDRSMLAAYSPASSLSLADTLQVQSADFNGDTFADLAVLRSNSISILISDGVGGFGSPVTTNLSTTPVDFTVGDFTGDGKFDVAVAYNTTNVDTFIGVGNGTFGSPVATTFSLAVSKLAAVNLNQDAYQDIIVAGTGGGAFALANNSGTGTFSASEVFTTTSTPVDIAVGDVDGDNDDDVCAAFTGSTKFVAIFNSDGAGGFDITPFISSTPTGIAVGDFNNDMKSDFVVSFSDRAPVIYSRPSVSWVTDSATLGASGANLPSGSGILALKINDDGIPDLAVYNAANSTLSVYASSGVGSYTLDPDGSDTVPGTAVFAADLNFDGYNDIVAANTAADTIDFYHSRFLTEITITTSPATVAYGDSLTLTAQVRSSFDASQAPPANYGKLRGSVEFYIDGMLAGTQTVSLLGEASLTVPTALAKLPVGTPSIVAKFIGGIFFGGSTSAAFKPIVEKGDVANTIAGPASSTFGELVTFTVTIAPSALPPNVVGPTGTVSFLMDGFVPLGSFQVVETMSPFTYTAQLQTAMIPAGTHTITAEYLGDINWKSALTSNSATIFVGLAPTVSSPTATNVALTTATLGGNVTDDGGATITERGIVYSITSLNNNPQIGGASVTQVTAAGTTGAFTIDVTALPPGTQISYAAYATNIAGTSYTTVSTFTTQPAIGQFPGITVQILGGQMIVTGTPDDDTIKVATDGMGGYIVTANKNINGLPSPQSFSGATSFVANTLGGHDDLWLAAPLILDSVTVDLGNGNDRLVLGADPNNAINNNVLDPQFGTLGYLTVNGPVSVIGGEGNDRVIERSTNINGVKTINLGEGNNEYNVYWGFSNETIFSSGAGADNIYIGYLSSREASQFDTGAGNDLISYYASRFYKTAYLNSGAGADTVALDVNIYDEATTVDTGSEADYLLFSRSVAYKSVVLTTAAGADTVLIGKYISGLGSNGAPIYSNGGSNIDDLTLNTGVEADTVQVAANVMRLFFANLGDAYDDAEVEFNLFTDGFLDGGGQDMRLRLRGNAGLRTRNPG